MASTSWPLPLSSREIFRRRREIHDAANHWLWYVNAGPQLGRDDSIIHSYDEVYVVAHEDHFPWPIQCIDYFPWISEGVVCAQMYGLSYPRIPTHRLLSTTGCFVIAMIKVQRKFRFRKVLRMLAIYRILPSIMQDNMLVRELVARFLCGPPVLYQPWPQQQTGSDDVVGSLGWRMLYRQ